MSAWNVSFLFLVLTFTCVQFGKCVLNLDGPLAGNLPDGYQSFVGEDQEKWLQEKCTKNGGKNAYDNFLTAKNEFQNCVKGLIDPTEIQNEIERAKPTGDLDSVFRKYCKLVPTLHRCIGNLTAAIDPCIDETEKSLQRTGKKIVEAVFDFVCYKEGEYIALFIAEKGPACVTDSSDALQSCMNATLNKYTPTGNDGISSLLKLGTQECQDLYTVQDCIVKQLEKCDDPTPANMVDSMINFVKKQTTCVNVPKKKN